MAPLNVQSNNKFQVKIFSVQIDNNVKIRKEIQLETCTEEHYPQSKADYNSLKIQDFLCPVLNYQINLQGTYGNQIFKYTNLEIATKD